MKRAATDGAFQFLLERPSFTIGANLKFQLVFESNDEKKFPLNPTADNVKKIKSELKDTGINFGEATKGSIKLECSGTQKEYILLLVALDDENVVKKLTAALGGIEYKVNRFVWVFCSCFDFKFHVTTPKVSIPLSLATKDIPEMDEKFVTKSDFDEFKSELFTLIQTHLPLAAREISWQPSATVNSGNTNNNSYAPTEKKARTSKK